jgi:hypothetical protein
MARGQSRAGGKMKQRTEQSRGKTKGKRDMWGRLKSDADGRVS